MNISFAKLDLYVSYVYKSKKSYNFHRNSLIFRASYRDRTNDLLITNQIPTQKSFFFLFLMYAFGSFLVLLGTLYAILPNLLSLLFLYLFFIWAFVCILYVYFNDTYIN
ncbi:hypothetical protein MCERE19_01468 [Spirosomataceae bacterium]